MESIQKSKGNFMPAIYILKNDKSVCKILNFVKMELFISILDT